MPFVSIILPYYRKINYVKKTINSILSQSFKDFEIILVYDDEDLHDLFVIENYFKKNSKIRIVKNTKNLGAGISRNIGIKHADGTIISFLDADDYWLPEKLNKQLKFMNENNYDFTFCDYEKKLSEKKNIKVTSSKKKIGYEDLIKSCDIGLSTVMISSRIKKFISFKKIKTKEDYILWLNLSKKYQIVGIDKFLTKWRKSENSLSSSTIQKITDAYKVYNKHLDYNVIYSAYRTFILSINYTLKLFKQKFIYKNV